MFVLYKYIIFLTFHPFPAIFVFYFVSPFTIKFIDYYEIHWLIHLFALLSFLIYLFIYSFISSHVSIQQECGSNFTSKLEGMFQDVELSRDAMAAFTVYSQQLLGCVNYTLFPIIPIYIFFRECFLESTALFICSAFPEYTFQKLNIWFTIYKLLFIFNTLVISHQLFII